MFSGWQLLQSALHESRRGCGQYCESQRGGPKDLRLHPTGIVLHTSQEGAHLTPMLYLS